MILLKKLEDNILHLTLNRPEQRNAFNAELIQLITEAIVEANGDDSIRLVLLRGEGKNFSAGADLNWMLSMKELPMEENVIDAKALATLMLTMSRCRKPIVTVVHGAVMGGGVGLTACSDIVFAQDNAFFSLSETKLGLSPATISPFVVQAIGNRQARRYMLTGERFSAERAFKIGLVHEVFSSEQIETEVNNVIQHILNSGPYSHPKIKKLIRDVGTRPIDETLMDNLAWRIANQRIADEGQEGIKAFLEKRTPSWAVGKKS